MPHPHSRHCKNCGGHSSVVGPISWGGNCRPCGIELQRENIVGLATHSGEPLRRWRRGMIACVAPWLLEDPPPESLDQLGTIEPHKHRA